MHGISVLRMPSDRSIWALRQAPKCLTLCSTLIWKGKIGRGCQRGLSFQRVCQEHLHKPLAAPCWWMTSRSLECLHSIGKPIFHVFHVWTHSRENALFLGWFNLALKLATLLRTSSPVLLPMAPGCQKQNFSTCALHSTSKSPPVAVEKMATLWRLT